MRTSKRPSSTNTRKPHGKMYGNHHHILEIEEAFWWEEQNWLGVSLTSAALYATRHRGCISMSSIIRRRSWMLPHQPAKQQTKKHSNRVADFSAFPTLSRIYCATWDFFTHNSFRHFPIMYYVVCVSIKITPIEHLPYIHTWLTHRTIIIHRLVMLATDFPSLQPHIPSFFSAFFLLLLTHNTRRTTHSSTK